MSRQGQLGTDNAAILKMGVFAAPSFSERSLYVSDLISTDSVPV
jgi:hypothetical protein